MGLVVDNFAGGGGASTGIEAALGRAIDIAINHDGEALAMHEANHPGTRHITNNIWQIDPCEVTGGEPVDLAWFSPDCKHFSKAKGGTPRAQNIRDLAWVVVLWAKQVRPAVIMLENVEEFRTWGPLVDGQPCPLRKGEEFDKWIRALKKLGYRVDDKELRACDYGAPTSRKRLFVIARCDGQPIVWPAPTHGAKDDPLVIAGLRAPYRTAADIIDWSIPTPSIFSRKIPLKPKTMRRIARGVKKFVLENPAPFLVHYTHAGSDRVHDIMDPMKTITGANRGEMGLAVPLLVHTAHGDVDSKGKKRGQGAHTLEKPIGALTQTRDQAVVTAFLDQHNFEGRSRPVDEPTPTQTQRGTQHKIVAVHIEQANTGMLGRMPDRPLSTIVQKGCTQRVVASHLLKFRGTCEHGQPVDEPMPALTAGGTHIAEIRTLLERCDVIPPGGEGPVLVEINGETYAIVDIGLRMLTPRELFDAQGFPHDYDIFPMVTKTNKRGKTVTGPMTKTSSIAKCGNSVSPPIAEALVAANFGTRVPTRMAA